MTNEATNEGTNDNQGQPLKAAMPDSVPDIGSARLQLRNDIRSSLQKSAGEPFVMLEDLLQSRFFRLGTREWEFIRILDGNRTLRDAIREYQQHAADRPLEPKDILTLCNWMLQSGLLHAGKTCAVPPAKSKTPTPWWLNPMFIRIPLFNPDSLLTTLFPYLAWTLSSFAVGAWAVVCLFGIAQIVVNFDRFSSSFSQILGVDNWLYLLLVWLGLKIVHELYHGLICKKYGGHVPRCGIMLIMFSPVAYVDVTSSWRFRSKWHRIYTAAGGIYVEFFVAAVAAIIWARTEPGILNQVCHNIVTMASVATVLFNGNFLMKFDGYYILTDFLEVQNLYSKGQQYLRYLVRRYLLNVTVREARWQKGTATLIRMYAFASLAWRIAFYVGIVAVAATMFHGAGVVLALLAGALWFLFPTLRFLKYMVVGANQEQPSRVRFGAIMLCLGGIVFAVASSPWPGGVTAPGVVQYAPLAFVRVDGEGFISTLHVQSGQYVQQGDVLISLDNPELIQELKDLELQMLQSDARCRMLQREDVSAYQIEKRNGESLVEQRDELAKKVDALTIRANGNGIVIGRDLDSLVGQYVETGTTLLAIGNEDLKEVAVSISQSDIDQFNRQKGATPYVRIKGRPKPVPNAELKRVEPKASVELPSVALAAPFGGPLTVTVRNDAEASDSNDQFILFAPRFTATVALTADQSQRLHAGELAKVRVGSAGKTVGQHVYGKLERWLRRKIDPTAQI